ncbi:MAG TPA: hypothetical protein VND40_03825 [Nitrososphaerales archaeon]|nr:hypothetical protein [Nitrososphaerales archaeon]
MNVKTALLGLFVVLTIGFASTTVYESGIRTTLTSTSTSTSTTTSVSKTTSTTTQTTTVTSTLDLTKTLTDAYLSHISAIESQNATALAAQYETNATLYYNITGLPSYLDGSVNGIANITRLYEGSLQTNKNNSAYVSCVTCFDLKVPFAAANETISVTVSSDEKAGNVTSHLVFYGTLSSGGCYVQGVGLCNTQAHAMGFDISYVLQGDRWLISTESLAYIYVDACITTYLSPDGSIFYCPGPYR